MKEKNKTNWYEIKLGPVKCLKDALINRMFELGIDGVVENDVADSVSGYIRESKYKDIVRDLEIYLASLGDLFPEAISLRPEMSEVAIQDWSKLYQETFTAQSLTNHFYLIPSWDSNTRPPFGKIPIVMESGLAFGTGLHATTCLCLSAMESAISVMGDYASVSVLDLGTGTGILAIAAEKLGVGRITAVDNDDTAVDVAVSNLARNQCERIDLIHTSADKVFGQYDIVVSNILLETHRELKNHYRRLMAPKGIVIVSGLLGDQHNVFCQELISVGLRLDSARFMQEWACLTFTEDHI